MGRRSRLDRNLADTEGIDAARSVAEQVIDSAYDYDSGPVLFKPTMASGEQTFRPSRAGALSYFVAHDPAYPLDGGFALKSWRSVRSQTSASFIDGDVAMWMGWMFMTDNDGGVTTVDKSFGYRRDAQGMLRIVLAPFLVGPTSPEPLRALRCTAPWFRPRLADVDDYGGLSTVLRESFSSVVLSTRAIGFPDRRDECASSAQVLTALAMALHLIQADPSLADDLLVIDPSGEWLQTWDEQFGRLEIDVLRSPGVHHPDPDVDALSAFITANGHMFSSGLPYDFRSASGRLSRLQPPGDRPGRISGRRSPSSLAESAPNPMAGSDSRPRTDPFSPNVWSSPPIHTDVGSPPLGLAPLRPGSPPPSWPTPPTSTFADWAISAVSGSSSWAVA